ncbi:MAG: class 1 fructose-bisphosphatase [Vampirovibrionia bacterium]
MPFDPLYKAFINISTTLRYKDIFTLGSDTSQTNTSQDIQKNIDILANTEIIKAISVIEGIIGYISEEEEKLVLFNKDAKEGQIVIFDPLDGSKNVFSDITVGTIYGIYNYNVEKDTIIDIVETGYSIYGPSTLLVRSINNEKVSIFSLNSNNEFDYVSDLSTSEKNAIYSINMSYDYEKDIHYFVNEMKKDGCTQRWCGAMVADAHQVLMRGGTFIYPKTSKNPKGKIRYLYEALPFAHLFTLLGGAAVDLNIAPIVTRFKHIKLNKGAKIHGEIPIILSTFYSSETLKNIFEINDIIKC